MRQSANLGFPRRQKSSGKPAPADPRRSSWVSLLDGAIIFKALSRRLITFGKLAIILPNGATVRLGDLTFNQEEPEVVIHLKSWLTAAKIALHPDLYFGEAYMNEAFVLEHGTLRQLLDLCSRNIAGVVRRRWIALTLLQKLVSRVYERNSLRSSCRNVAHHYDLKESLFRLFLDGDLQYSCAYFRSSTQSLEQAQLEKKNHIISKLLLKPGHRVVDIGCGWGGLAMSIVQRETVQMTAVTVSPQQLLLARARAREIGIDHRISFELKDYRELQSGYDRAVSVGMFEHVGRPNYQIFFDKIANILNEDGVALIHSIGRAEGPGQTSAWTRRYIFPGGYIPALSEVIPAVERAGLWITDIEILRLHYAETLREWGDRFAANRQAVRSIYDERFCKMWEFYLAGSEMAFRHNRLMVFQLQIAKRVDSVPITREYMFEGERRTSPNQLNPAAA